VLTGGEPVHLRQLQEKRRVRGIAKGAGAAAQLDDSARERWERLRNWRADIAKEHGVPAYVVFHDATLAEIAHERPATIAALSRISGVGARKLERYGADLLALLRD
jgi:ATP-dependent DNA helicase RecQ